MRACTPTLGRLTPFVLLAVALAGGPKTAHAQSLPTIKVDVIKQPYVGERNVPELSHNPDYIHAAGLEALIEQWGGELVRPIRAIQLREDEEDEYGSWHRLGLANGHFADAVAASMSADLLMIGLEANCSSLLGMLGGLSRGADGQTRAVGLVFIDAHGDFNTPETTLSGMLGGMPVAVAAGHGLERFRMESGLETPIPMDHIVWGGVRDLDPLEADRFEEFQVRQVSVGDLVNRSDRLHAQMRALSERVDVIYIHIDMDVLEPDEVPGHGLRVPNGPSSEALGLALRDMFRYPKAVALGVASTPAGSNDPRGISRRAALNLIRGAMEGVRGRDR